MNQSLDFTHDPQLRSWVEAANDPAGDFPIQNLPFGRYRETSDQAWRRAVAIGDHLLDLNQEGSLADADDITHWNSNKRQALRHHLVNILSAGQASSRLRNALRKLSEVELGLPCPMPSFTDFYTGIHHAKAVGALFRPDQPLLPNYPWVPIAYHARASSLIASGSAFHRPRGQVMSPNSTTPTVQASARLDYELELGVVIGQGNALGQPIPLDRAEQHILGVTLLNDWSARDIQAWEYQPLGPFLAKNFATSVSPWLVTLEALAPFRAPFNRAPEWPEPLGYLQSPAHSQAGQLSIQLSVYLRSEQMRDQETPPALLSQSNAHDAYWTLAQMVAHHTLNGCNLEVGDLLGTGTLSGPSPQQGGSLLELTQGGKQAITLPNQEQRRFLADGDEVIFTGRCEREGFVSIGFGSLNGRVLAAIE